MLFKHPNDLVLLLQPLIVTYQSLILQQTHSITHLTLPLPASYQGQAFHTTLFKEDKHCLHDE